MLTIKSNTNFKNKKTLTNNKIRINIHWIEEDSFQKNFIPISFHCFSFPFIAHLIFDGWQSMCFRQLSISHGSIGLQ